MRKEQRNQSLARERGIGVILVLLAIMILSVLTAGIVLTGGKEVYSSNNYRIDTQSLYLAQAGVQAGINWFKNSYTPAAASSYTLTGSPVKLAINGKVVKLDGITKVYDYPDAATKTSFQTNLVDQTLTVSTTPALSGTFNVRATLRSARQITVLGSGPTLLERWVITAQGNAAGGVAEASAIITKFPQAGLPNYAALSCATGPASLKIGDSSHSVIAGTDSYDSGLGGYGPGNMGTQGNIATNGEYNQDGGTVNGNASYASITGTGTITGTSSVVPTAYDCSTLPLPTTSPGTTNVTINSGMSPYTLNPAVAPYGNYGNVLCTSACDLTLMPGTYNMNSLEVDSGSTIHITGPTVVNIVGTGATSSGKAVYLDSNTLVNTGPPANFMLFVNRTEPVTADSGVTAAYVLIAPKSDVYNDSNTTMYGMIIGKTIVQDSGAVIHYDLALQRLTMSLSPYTVISWNRSSF